LSQISADNGDNEGLTLPNLARASSAVYVLCAALLSPMGGERNENDSPARAAGKSSVLASTEQGSNTHRHNPMDQVKSSEIRLEIKVRTSMHQERVRPTIFIAGIVVGLLLAYVIPYAIAGTMTAALYVCLTEGGC
jgi:hypothetical protein